MSSDAPLRKSLIVQSRVLHALMMREVITRFGRDNLGALWLIAEPMIFTLGIVTLWTATGWVHGSSLPITAFAVTGYSSVLLWRNCSTRAISALDVNLPLLFHRNVKAIDVFLTRTVLEIAGATGSFAVLSMFFISIGWMELPLDMMQVIFGWLMLAWFGAALALVMGAFSAHSHVVEKLWQPAAYLFFPISGAAFMVDWLSPSFKAVVLLLPMVHGVEILRGGYFGNAVTTHFDVGYMVTCNLVFSFLGLLLVRNASQKVQER